MLLRIRDFLFQRRIAPKAFQCSSCGALVDRGRVYTKTNYGRFCANCDAEMKSEPSYVLSQ